MALQPLVFALKCILQVKYENKNKNKKQTNDSACFFTLFRTLDLI